MDYSESAAARFIYYLMLGIIAVLGLVIVVLLNKVHAEPEVTDRATFRCPFPSGFSFVRKTDDTIEAYCVGEPTELTLPQVEVHAASTKPYILDHE
jgi:hypothetical protein